MAVRFGNVKIVELLLKNGADPNIECDLTPLGVAVQTNCVDMVKRLVDAKADVNIATHPVRRWIKGWSEPRKYVFNGFSVLDVKDFTMQTPLHIAARLNFRIIYNYLINVNAKENILDGKKLFACDILCRRTDRETKRPLHEGILSLIELCKTLSLNSIHCSSILKRHNLNAVSCSTKRTPLHMLCSTGLIDLVQSLMKFGADVRAVDKYGNTPMHIACYCGQKQIVKLLLLKSYYQLVDSVNEEGYTPLMMACRENKDEIVQILLKKGANVNMGADINDTALHVACINGLSEVAELLIENGAEINCRNKIGATPLKLAFQNNHCELVCRLIEKGATIDDSLACAINTQRLCLLEMACETDNIGVLHNLLSIGAKLNVEKKYFDTLVKEQKYLTAKLLIQSRCCNPEQEQLLDILSTVTMFGYIRNHECIEFCIWCFEELGYEMFHLCHNLEMIMSDTGKLYEQSKYHIGLKKWMREKMSEVPSLKVECRKNIKSYLSKISNNRSILPAINGLPLPKDMKLLLNKNLYSPDDPTSLSMLDLEDHEFVLYSRPTVTEARHIHLDTYDSYWDEFYDLILETSHRNTIDRCLRIQHGVTIDSVLDEFDNYYQTDVEEKELKRNHGKYRENSEYNIRNRPLQTVRPIKKQKYLNNKFKKH